VKTYRCPACGEKNSADDSVARAGIKCASCGTGYIPVKIETRTSWQPDQRKDVFFWGVVGLILTPLALLTIIYLNAFLWLILPLLLLVLLGGIFYQLWRFNQRTRK
jgi:DNA-directed RNA polymerase subunit RPC12/RpoP